jgi:hypothetical protein
MAWTACSFCRKRFFGKGITAYHRWWEGEDPEAWKQKACPSCAPTAWANVFKYAADSVPANVEMPSVCSNCGGSLESQGNVIYHSFFQGKSRRDLVAVLCDDDLLLVAPSLIEGGVRLGERGDAQRGGSGGAVATSADTLFSLGRLP